MDHKIIGILQQVYRSTKHAPIPAETYALGPLTSSRRQLGGKGYDYQPDAFTKLCDAPFGRLIGPPGCGKTSVGVALIIHKIIQSRFRMKALIAIPQSGIAKGWVGRGTNKFQEWKVDGEDLEWMVADNFCADNSTDILDRLEEWLDTPAEDLHRNLPSNVVMGVVAVVTTQALTMLWERSSTTDEKRERWTKNLLLVVDEYHHVRNVLSANPEDETAYKLQQRSNANALGRICQYILRSRKRGAQLLLMSATPFRGDGEPTLSAAALGEIVTYLYRGDKHMEAMNLDYFMFEYELTKDVDEMIQAVCDHVANELKDFHGLYVPRRGGRWRRIDESGLLRLFDALQAIPGLAPERILDLVTPEKQAANQKRLEDNPEAFTVVVACNKFDEGVDWVLCNRIHNTACEESLRLAIQRIGRTSRIEANKRNIHIRHYLPELRDDYSRDDLADLLNDRTNGVLVQMMVGDMFQPVMIPLPVRHVRAGEGTGGSQTEMRPLADAFGSDYTAMLEDGRDRLLGLKERTVESVTEVMDGLLADYNITEAGDVVRMGLLAKFLPMLVDPERRVKLDFPLMDYAFVREHGFAYVVREYVDSSTDTFRGKYVNERWPELYTIIETQLARQFRIFDERTGGDVAA